MGGEDTEKPALVEEIGLLEGLTITKGPQLLPSPEMLENVFDEEDV